MRLFRRSPEPSESSPSAPRRRAADTARCADLAEIGVDPANDPPPQDGVGADCQDCIALGEHNWAHLRKCLTCGHVGCCDSSPRRHATAHHHDTDHPVMRSAEPGEEWRWCYRHEVMG